MDFFDVFYFLILFILLFVFLIVLYILSYVATEMSKENYFKRLYVDIYENGIIIPVTDLQIKSIQYALKSYPFDCPHPVKRLKWKPFKHLSKINNNSQVRFQNVFYIFFTAIRLKDGKKI